MSTRVKMPPQVWPPQGQPGMPPNHPHARGVLQPKPAVPQAKPVPAAPPVYRPQHAPRVLQPKVNASQHPSAQAKPSPTTHALPTAHTLPTAHPAHAHRPHPAAAALQAKPHPGHQPSCGARPCAHRPPAAPKPPLPAPKTPPGFAGAAPRVNTFAPRAPHAAQPKMAAGHPLVNRRPPQIPTPAAAKTVPPPAASNPGGAVQLVRRTRSKATVKTGTLTTPISAAKKFSSKKEPGGRVKNVRGLVRKGNTRKRVATTKGSKSGKYTTTESSAPINSFLKKAGLYSHLTRLEGGHAIADVYGGPTARTNTFPLPHAFNTITYKKAESSLKKKLSAKRETAMEVSVEYPDDPLEGFLTPAEKRQLAKRVTPAQLRKLEAIFELVPGWMAWEVNNKQGGHNWTEFDNIRKDFWPTGTKPANIINKDFIKAVRKL